MSQPAKEKPRIVVFQDGEAWIAQCVDYDIAAQGIDLPAARERIVAVIHAEMAYTFEKYGKEFHGLDAPPEIYDTMFNSNIDESLQSRMDFRIAA